MFGFNAVQFVGSIITVLVSLAIYYAMARHSSTPAVKKMLLLVILLGALFVTLGDSCEDTDPVIFHDDGSVQNLDTNIEKVAEPLLDFGDDIVKEVRDAEKEIIRWGKDADDDMSDLWGVGAENID